MMQWSADILYLFFLRFIIHLKITYLYANRLFITYLFIHNFFIWLQITYL